MENNKILIGIQFTWLKKTNDPESQYTHVLALYVLRDITIKQLLEAIYYGLQKKIHSENSIDAQLCQDCLNVFTRVTQLPPNSKFFRGITLSRYDHEKAAAAIGSSDPVLFSTDHLHLPLCDVGFTHSTHLIFFDPNINIRHGALNDSYIIPPFKPSENPLIRFPEYNISTRERYQFDKSPISILPPSDPPQKPDDNLLATLLPTAISMSMMMFARSANSGFDWRNLGSSAIMVAMMIAGTAISGAFVNTRKHQEYSSNLEKWRSDYQDYINRTMIEIQKRQENDRHMLNLLYPDIDKLALHINQGIFTYNDQIFSRGPNDDDFLSVRLGTCDQVESLFPIEAEAREEICSNAGYTIEQTHRSDCRYSVRLTPTLPARTGIKGAGFFSDANNDVLPLNSLPSDIQDKYRYLTDTPLIYSLKDKGALGIVDKNVKDTTNTVPGIIQQFQSHAAYMIHRMIFELCYYHSPENLQFVIFFHETNNPAIIKEYTHAFTFLPHFRGLFDDKSQFVFNRESASTVMGSLAAMMAHRSAASQADEQKADGQTDAASKLPHIVLIVFDEFGLKEHVFAQYLPAAPNTDQAFSNDLGLSFIFAAKYKEYLPAYCNDVIRVEDSSLVKPVPDHIRFTITPREDINQRKTFLYPNVQEEHIKNLFSQRSDKRSYSSDKFYAFRNQVYNNAFNFLSSVYYTRISQNGKVPSSVNIFELMGINEHTLESYIETSWGLAPGSAKRKANVTKSLAVPLGRNEIGITYLDLHEKADGPHMLVAGTTGSGKSETIISLLLGLCMTFRPNEVNLLLVDMKGGGFTQRLHMLPHVVGTVTDVDGDENGTGAEYMLRRFLNAMKSEIKRRKILFNKMYVDNIDDYIKACNDISAHIAAKNIPADQRAEVKRMADEEQLSHLILVVDEFTELKRFSSETSDVNFIEEITTIARVGRSLGYHICLISQNIQGAITEDISVNSKSRLCLKVATRQASKEMIGNELAAAPSMPGMGRAYLLVGTGSKFEYFQSAYSGANSQEGLTGSNFQITEASTSGPYRVFYDSREDNTKMKQNTAELKKSGRLRSQLEAITDAIVKVNQKYAAIGMFRAPHRVFQPPLPRSLVMDQDGNITDDNGKLFRKKKI